MLDAKRTQSYRASAPLLQRAVGPVERSGSAWPATANLTRATAFALMKFNECRTKAHFFLHFFVSFSLSAPLLFISHPFCSALVRLSRGGGRMRPSLQWPQRRPPPVCLSAFSAFAVTAYARQCSCALCSPRVLPLCSLRNANYSPSVRLPFSYRPTHPSPPLLCSTPLFLLLLLLILPLSHTVETRRTLSKLAARLACASSHSCVTQASGVLRGEELLVGPTTRQMSRELLADRARITRMSCAPRTPHRSALLTQCTPPETTSPLCTQHSSCCSPRALR